MDLEPFPECFAQYSLNSWQKEGWVHFHKHDHEKCEMNPSVSQFSFPSLSHTPQHLHSFHGFHWLIHSFILSFIFAFFFPKAAAASFSLTLDWLTDRQTVNAVCYEYEFCMRYEEEEEDDDVLWAGESWSLSSLWAKTWKWMMKMCSLNLFSLLFRSSRLSSDPLRCSLSPSHFSHPLLRFIRTLLHFTVCTTVLNHIFFFAPHTRSANVSECRLLLNGKESSS